MNKVKETFEVCEDQLSWLDAIVEKFDLEDRGKAVRILLDYGATDGDADAIFGSIRCRHC
jgi:hypothetical protein